MLDAETSCYGQSVTSTSRELAPRVPRSTRSTRSSRSLVRVDRRRRRCAGLATTFAVLGSAMMLPVLLVTPALMSAFLPLGLLWLMGVVVPGATLTIRHYRYVLDERLPGGTERLWGQTAASSGLLGAVWLYTCAAAGAGLAGIPGVLMCILAGAAMVAAKHDRHAL